LSNNQKQFDFLPKLSLAADGHVLMPAGGTTKGRALPKLEKISLILFFTSQKKYLRPSLVSLNFYAF
jgi:hypothetical protein